MTHPLQDLTGSDFRVEAGAISSAKALRRSLLRNERVANLRKALQEGRVSEPTVQRFVARLMSDFRRGIQFPHELALSAIAVALQDRKTRFAEDYLLDLARLQKFSEMDIAPRIAGICLQAWHKAPETIRKAVPPTSSHRFARRRITSVALTEIEVSRTEFRSYRKKTITWLSK